MPWHSFEKHLLRPWKADLAVLTDFDLAGNSSLVRLARYKWHEPEHYDWGEVIDTIPDIRPDWRTEFCSLKT